MKVNEIKELQNLSVAELNTKLSELKEELFNLRFRHATGQLENPVSLRNCKKDIARVQTVIRQKELKA
jgi:large subunit ribosomal protein L29